MHSSTYQQIHYDKFSTNRISYFFLLNALKMQHHHGYGLVENGSTSGIYNLDVTRASNTSTCHLSDMHIFNVWQKCGKARASILSLMENAQHTCLQIYCIPCFCFHCANWHYRSRLYKLDKETYMVYILSINLLSWNIKTLLPIFR